jgi:hypothetical protein
MCNSNLKSLHFANKHSYNSAVGTTVYYVSWIDRTKKSKNPPPLPSPQGILIPHTEIGCVWFHIHNINVISALGLCRTLHVDLYEESLTYMKSQSVREYLSHIFILLFLCEHYWQRFVPNTGSFKYLVNTTKTGVDRTFEASCKSEVSNGCGHNESKLFILHYIVRNPT